MAERAVESVPTSHTASRSNKTLLYIVYSVVFIKDLYTIIFE